MKLERVFAALNISAEGLRAQRKRMNVVSENIANAETTRTEGGEPYRRKVVRLSATDQNSFVTTLQQAAVRLDAPRPDHFTGVPLEIGQGDQSPMSIAAEEVNDPTPFKLVYNPGHPDADERGYVRMPNVNIVTEMVDMISASRAFEANVVAIGADKSMAKDSLEI